MFLSYLIEISLLWLLLEATAPAFQRRILRDFFPGLPRGRGCCRRARSRQWDQPRRAPARPCAALAAPRPPRAPGGPEQTNSTSREGFADADTHLTGRAGSVRPEF